jgi:DNA polymerase-3 subunit gamma/tau
VSYQVLARKYRPQTFEEVVGQGPIVTTLRNAVEQNRIHHAYLFSGLRGVGKTTVARLMAKALNCREGPTARPCNACPSCEEVAASRSLDVLEIDGASNRGIDAVRELRETVRYTPARDRHRIYIIDEVHMLTPEAWNALLKTLEEPPAHVVFLFATTEYRKIPLTIMSRCQHFEFKKIAHSEMLSHLKTIAEGEGIEVQPAALDLMCRMAAGSLRDAQSALDQAIAFSGNTVSEDQARTVLGVIDRELITGFFTAVRARDPARLVAIVDEVFEKGYPPVPFLEDLMAHGRDLLLARVVDDPGRYLPGDAHELRSLAERAAAFTDDELLRLLELMTREEPRLKNTAHPRFLLEALAIKLARLADLQPIEELLARLDRPSDGPSSPAPGRSSPHPGAGAPTRGRSASSASPAPAASGDQALVESFLKRVHEERGAVGGFLGQAAWLEIVDETLQIAFHQKHGFFREKVESRDVLEYLRRVAREVAGRDLAVKVILASPASLDQGNAPAAESEAARKQHLHEEARKEPIVKTLLDTFEGEIVDVEQA